MDPIEVLKLLSSKPIVVGIAVVGALFTCLPFVFSKKEIGKEEFPDNGDDAQTGHTHRWVKLM